MIETGQLPVRAATADRPQWIDRLSGCPGGRLL